MTYRIGPHLKIKKKEQFKDNWFDLGIIKSLNEFQIQAVHIYVTRL